MAKSLVSPNSISAQYTEAMRKQLETAQMSAADIDKLIAKSGVETILTQKNLGQYFRNAEGYLKAICDRYDEPKALSGAAPNMGDYAAYWNKDLDTHRGVPGLDYLPAKFLFTRGFVPQYAGFNPKESAAWDTFIYGPPAPTQGAPVPGSPVPPQGGASGGDTSGGYSGGGGGKSMSTGGYGGGSKAMSTGGYGSSKSLDMPGPPPGGGGYPPGGYGGYESGGGNYSSQNMNFFPQAEWDWAQRNLPTGSNLGADWLQPLFGTSQQFREITAYGVERLNELDQFQQRIMTEFQNLDLTTADGQRKQFMLTNELQNINGKKQEYMDKMMRIQHMHDELISGLKGLQQKVFDDVNAIIRNVGK